MKLEEFMAILIDIRKDRFNNDIHVVLETSSGSTTSFNIEDIQTSSLSDGVTILIREANE